MTQLLELRMPEIAYPADGSVAPVYRATWQPVELAWPEAEPSARLRGKKIAIAGGRDETAARIAARLERYGAIVFRYPLDPAEAGTALAAFLRDHGPADGIIDLNVEEPYRPERGENWTAAMRQSVTLLKAFYMAWATATDATRHFYLPVTRLGGTMGFALEGAGRGKISHPFGGIWAGLAKTLPREIPNCNLKILDLADEDFERVDELIAREIYRWGLFEIGYRAGRRYTLACRQREAASPEIELGPGDTVLISGGGRGIGFALAKELALNFNCRVIVTGRGALPAAGQDWLEMDEAAFKNYGHHRLKNPPPGRKIGDLRRELEQLKNSRELYHNLAEAARQGLRLEYRACDFKSPEQVGRLLAELGPALSGVIHNAGVDAPVRLPSKPTDGFIETIRTKISSFLNLFQALKDARLKFFCNVGSLTGRWGGMVGQLDYASANEGLSRLGLWAAEQAAYPVKTLCWPTWNRLGMIANFEATLKYMAAVDVAEGVYHWQRELLTGGPGEICFNAPVGKALTPALLRGFPEFSEVPQAGRLYSQLFYTGQVEDFAIFKSARAVSRVEAAYSPCVYDFRVAGRPALPVSLLLEYALSTGEWVAPEGWPQLYLREIRDLEISLPGLALDGHSLTLEKEGSGSWQDGFWQVAVRFNRLDGEKRETLARLELVYSREAPAAPAFEPVEEGTARFDLPAIANLGWTGQVFRPARWQATASGKLQAEVRPVPASDLWTVTYPPEPALPVNLLENTWRAAAALQAQQAAILRITRLGWLAAGLAGAEIAVGERSGANWSMLDRSGQPLLAIEGLKFS